MNRVTSFVLSVSALLAMMTAAWAVEDSGLLTKEAIGERIKPVGEVYVGEAPVAAAASAGAGRGGEEVYNAACMACHTTGAAGAPKLGDQGAWQPRIAQGKDTLYQHAINGINAMPAKGGCMSCSDEEVQAAVDYLIQKSQ